MKFIKIILVGFTLMILLMSCGSEGSNRDQPIDSTNNIILPEDRSTDSIGTNTSSYTTADSARSKMDSSANKSVPVNTRSKTDSTKE